MCQRPCRSVNKQIERRLFESIHYSFLTLLYSDCTRFQARPTGTRKATDTRKCDPFMFYSLLIVAKSYDS